MLESFTPDTFRPLQGSTFRLKSGDHELEVVLAQVAELKAAEGPGSRGQFSLIFHGPLQPVWGQRTYRVQHPDLGTFDLFVVPLGPDGRAMRYEAVFG